MIGRIAALLILLGCANTAPETPGVSPTPKSCREHPRLIGKCFVARGSLSVHNGAPAIRLTRIGTRRVLGVSEQRFNLPGYRNLPDGLAEQLNGENEIIGDFLVCPFTRSKPGEMQLVCIESADKTSVQKRKQ